MSGLEALQAVQFVTVEGRRLAVIDAEDWESLVDWLETLEDISLAKEAQRSPARLRGDRGRAGWLRWDDVKEGTRMIRYTVYVVPDEFRSIKRLPGNVRQRVTGAPSTNWPTTPGRLTASKSTLRDWKARPRSPTTADRQLACAVSGESDSERTVDVVAVRKRPPYDYGALSRLLGGLP